METAAQSVPDALDAIKRDAHLQLNLDLLTLGRTNYVLFHDMLYVGPVILVFTPFCFLPRLGSNFPGWLVAILPTLFLVSLISVAIIQSEWRRWTRKFATQGVPWVASDDGTIRDAALLILAGFAISSATSSAALVVSGSVDLEKLSFLTMAAIAGTVLPLWGALRIIRHLRHEWPGLAGSVRALWLLYYCSYPGRIGVRAPSVRLAVLLVFCLFAITISAAGAALVVNFIKF